MSKERVLLNLTLEDFEEFEAKRKLTGMDKQHLVRVLLNGLQPFYRIEKEVKEVIDSNEKIVIAIIAPAVRVSMGEQFGIEPGENVEGKLVTSLKKVGFDYVFDTAFGADLTILEEVAEFAERLKNKDRLPQFTSCCPAWVKYVSDSFLLCSSHSLVLRNARTDLFSPVHFS